ncbi:muconolactone Delta-isomerase [Glacieibacterium frigidum]|uniref:Muconolactone isomerase domain-containing protein n=1 Tax=Glacieibacterium frigidum TaxID=2593303 RepID=A0A552UEQ8_9SPHN|nr:muconolactone Delta-isomerase family protein [Glacieibacterium frigidum]TRW16710.1 hypothetical protein FMM06_00385 [Glacieibacterium frigidum]
MLYHVKIQIDQQALGFDAQREQIASADAAQALELKEAGALKALWRRADAGGSIFVVEAEDHQALASILQGMPIFEYLKNIEVTPIYAHPTFA